MDKCSFPIPKQSLSDIVWVWFPYQWPADCLRPSLRSSLHLGLLGWSQDDVTALFCVVQLAVHVPFHVIVEVC